MKRSILGYCVIGLALLLMVTLGAAYTVARQSLPMLDGEKSLSGLGAPATVLRDSRGMPTVRAASTVDAFRVLGYLHAQDRFFQMDLLRRSSAGELAALLGDGVLPQDIARRPFRLRAKLRTALSTLDSVTRHRLTAYTEGVNSGLDDLESRPFEYWLLRQRPKPWHEEDSLLVLCTMFFSLTDAFGEKEQALHALQQGLPSEMVAFLNPVRTEWDAPLIEAQEAEPPAAIPRSKVFDLRIYPSEDFAPIAEGLPSMDYRLGSNNWAISGHRTETGAALVAGDMHLPYALPHTWYRARLWQLGHDNIDATGLTLPGLPMLVAGSNGHVAWALTNSYGDWTGWSQESSAPR